MSVWCVCCVERRELIRVDLCSGNSTGLEIAFLQITRVELYVVRQYASVTLVDLIDKDLFDSIGVVLVSLRNQALTHLLKSVL